MATSGCGNFTVCSGFSEVSENASDGYKSQADANTLCAEKGAGWRLPTNGELKCMCNNKSSLPGGYKENYYWSSVGYSTRGRAIDFKSCKDDPMEDYFGNYVRCVK
jgi:hypothetical protein